MLGEAAVVLVFALSLLPVQAFASGPVSVVLTQFKVVKGSDGKEALVDATHVVPGDILEYHVTYRNTGHAAVKSLVAGLPIPEGTAYLANSARPGGQAVRAATKLGVYAVEPLVRTIPATTVNGQAVAARQVPVPYEDYRSLHWTLAQLNAGAEVTYSARVSVQKYKPPVVGSGAAQTASH